jgi:hypothetical protein
MGCGSAVILSGGKSRIGAKLRVAVAVGVAVVMWQWQIRMGYIIASILSGDKLIIGGSGLTGGSGWVAVAESDGVGDGGHFEWWQVDNRRKIEIEWQWQCVIWVGWVIAVILSGGKLIIGHD